MVEVTSGVMGFPIKFARRKPTSILPPTSAKAQPSQEPDGKQNLFKRDPALVLGSVPVTHSLLQPLQIVADVGVDPRFLWLPAGV